MLTATVPMVMKRYGLKLVWPSWFDLLIGLQDGLNAHQIGQQQRWTASHLLEIAKDMEENELIVREKSGRAYGTYLTTKGLVVLDAIKTIKEAMDNAEKERSNEQPEFTA